MPREWPKGKPWDGSASRLARYERCPRAHRHRYVDKWPDPTRPGGRVGLLVHGALEVVGRARLQVECAKPVEAAELVEALGTATPDVAEVEPSEIVEAKELLEQLAPFDLAGGGVMLVEHPFTVRLSGGVRFGGFFDLVRRSTSGEWVEVVDWKTGGNVPTEAEASVDPQVGLMLAAARQYHLEGGGDPDRPIRCVLHYVRSGIKIKVRWTRELDRFVRARASAAHEAWSKGHDRPRVGEGCASCPYRDRCEPARKHIEQLEVYRDPPEAKDLPFPALVRERQLMAETAKLADARRKDLDQELQQRLKRSGQSGVDVGRWRASMRERKTRSYDVALVPELAAELELDPFDVLRKVTKISNAPLRKLIAGDEDLTELAQRYSSEKAVKFVEVRKARGPF